MSVDFANRSLENPNTQSVSGSKAKNAPFQQRSVQLPKSRLKPIKPKTEQKKRSFRIWCVEVEHKVGGEEAIKLVEELRKKLHKELFEVLEAEQKKEVEREDAIQKVCDARVTNIRRSGKRRKN